jgi:hypothetical protein
LPRTRTSGRGKLLREFDGAHFCGWSDFSLCRTVPAEPVLSCLSESLPDEGTPLEVWPRVFNS